MSVLCIGFLPEYPWCPLIPQGLMLLFTLIKQPYEAKKENKRSIFIHFLFLLATSMNIYHFYSDKFSRRFFLFPFLMEFALLVGLIISYVFIIKEFIEEMKNRKKMETTVILCEDDQTVRKIGKQVKEEALKRNTVNL